MMLGMILLATVVGFGGAALAFGLGAGLWPALGIGWVAGLVVMVLVIVLRVRRVMRGAPRPQGRVAEMSAHLAPKRTQ